MPEEQQADARILDVRPIHPIMVALEFRHDDDSKEQVQGVFYLDQVGKKIYDANQGPVDDGLRDLILHWIEKKHEEAASKILAANPEMMKKITEGNPEFARRGGIIQP